MEKSKSNASAAPRRPPASFPRSSLLLALFFLFVLSGCGAPGEPSPPRRVVPQAVSDLAARQLGDGVLLSFTLPKKAADGLALAERPSVEIYRGTPAPRGKPAANALRLVFTIPPALLDDYLTGGQVQFRDPLPPESVAKPDGEPLVYTVRTRASQKRASADSNAAALRVYPVPQPINDVQARVTESAIELSWTPPAQSASGAPLPPLAGYRVYRAELEPPADAAAPQEDSKLKRKAPLELLGSPSEAKFRDTQIEFGRAYLYFVRSVARYGSEVIESADSAPVVVSPRDVFPPAPPKNIVAIAVPAAGDAAAHIELSWSIGEETDLAGYNVYRTEGSEASARGERLNRQLVLGPAFRDITAVPGRRYTYRVTSVDRTGNESAPSASVSLDFPAPLP
jgi:hypothetical protein